MVHQYKLNGYNIVLDISSGAVHVVDDIAYDIISLFENNEKEKIDQKKTAFYLMLFTLTILMVFRVIPYYICLPIILISILATDKRAEVISPRLAARSP